MIALLYKDIIIQKKMVVFAGIYSVFFFAMMAFMPENPQPGFVYAFSPVVVAFMLIFGAFKADKNDTEVFVYSLPYTRDDLTAAKFLSMGVYALFGIVTTAVFGALFCLLPDIHRWYVPLDFLRILNGLFFLSIFLPFYFRFGFAIVKIVVVVLLSLGVAVQVAFLGMQFSGDKNFLVRAIDAFLAAPVLRRNLVITAILAAAFALSLLLSIRINRRKVV